MSSPSRSTFPSTLVLGIVSCIRFRQRIRVDLPQPEGPMIAVTACSSISSVIPSIARFGPYQPDNASVWTFTAIRGSPRRRADAGHDSRDDADREHDEDQDEGRPPGCLVLDRVWAQGPGVDRVLEGLNRVVEAREPERVPEGGHDERGRLARDPRDTEEAAGDEAAARRGQNDAQDRPMLG